jgi:hypothetical protein
MLRHKHDFAINYDWMKGLLHAPDRWAGGLVDKRGRHC